MNTQKSVYKRLFTEAKKTELESQKIELSLLDDLDKIANRLKGHLGAVDYDLPGDAKELEFFIKSYDKAKKELDNISEGLKRIDSRMTGEIKEAENRLSDIQSQLESIHIVLNKIGNQAKELGVNPKSIPGYSSADKLYNEGISLMKEIAKEIDQAQGVQRIFSSRKLN